MVLPKNVVMRRSVWPSFIVTCLRDLFISIVNPALGFEVNILFLLINKRVNIVFLRRQIPLELGNSMKDHWG